VCVCLCGREKHKLLFARSIKKAIREQEKEGEKCDSQPTKEYREQAVEGRESRKHEAEGRERRKRGASRKVRVYCTIVRASTSVRVISFSSHEDGRLES
jgi:hypothetical protein